MLRIFLVLVLAAAVALADPCPNCGKEVEKGFLCPECGTVIPNKKREAQEETARAAAVQVAAKKAELMDALRRLLKACEDAGDRERADQVLKAILAVEDVNSAGLSDESSVAADRFFRNRVGNHLNLLARGGGTQGPGSTEEAVTAGLSWLARHQSAEGCWSAGDFNAECGDGTRCPDAGYAEYDAGLTGLALLAFLGAGQSHLTKDTYLDPHTGKTVCWGEVVKNGLKWLLSHQDPDGYFGDRRGSKHLYNHAIATLAMTEAYGLAYSALFKDSARKGIDYLLDAQNPGKAWRYTRGSGENDTSVTGWCVMALKAADVAGLNVDQRAFDGARAWIVEVTDEALYKVGYNAKGTGKVVTQGKNEDFEGHETMTAIGMLARIFIDANRKDPALAGGAKLLVADLPTPSGKKIDYYYWHYGSLALFQLDGPDGKFWSSWNEAMKNALVLTQKVKKDGCLDGSWDAGVDRWGFEGGRVYATALNVLTLEVYYRYGRVFFPSKRK